MEQLLFKNDTTGSTLKYGIELDPDDNGCVLFISGK